MKPFRHRSALEQHSLHFGPNMTPMVDVVMVILVFFMVSAAFVGPEWFITALLPQPAQSASTEQTNPQGQGKVPPPTASSQPLRLTFTLQYSAAAKATLFTGEGLTDAPFEQFEAKLTDLTKGLPKDELAAKLEMLLEPQANVPTRDVVRAHELATKLGIVRVGYSTP